MKKKKNSINDLRPSTLQTNSWAFFFFFFLFFFFCNGQHGFLKIREGKEGGMEKLIA